jgi:shikimate kinase / 3-dehydroquinate synthase
MGAGKTTIGRRVAELTQRKFIDLDEEIEKRHGPIARIFEERGEAEFRRLEEEALGTVLAGPDRAVISLGGGTLLSTLNRGRLGAKAFTVHIDVDVDTAWERVRGTTRPLAQREKEFRRLYEERRQMYRNFAEAVAGDVDGVLLACLDVVVRRGAIASLNVREEAVLVADERVLQLHRPPLDIPVLTVPAGEEAKTPAVVERLWEELRLGRDGVIVAFGGGSTTDVAGFVAATYLRRIGWIAVPTTLTGQVDAAIGGKTGINLRGGKNLVGTFNRPHKVVVDPDVLTTLPEEERRAGMAEVVKTSLLAGHEFWHLPEEEMIRGCAAFKCAVVISDFFESGEIDGRVILNLGHTFAHALEAGSGYTVRHGDAVALGLLAALRLSGQPTDVVEEVLDPKPVRADPEVAWAALKRDKKGEGVFVLLEEPGKPVVTTVPDEDARRALEALIQK